MYFHEKAAPVQNRGSFSNTYIYGRALEDVYKRQTYGKKKYAELEPALERIMEKAENLRNKLTGLINRDAEAFEPLSKAYSIPKDDPNKAPEMERCFKLACSVPMEIEMCIRDSPCAFLMGIFKNILRRPLFTYDTL